MGRICSSFLPRRLCASDRAVSRVVQAELTKGDRQVAWRFLKQLFSLFDQAGGGLGLGLHEMGDLFQLCSMSDSDSLQVEPSALMYLSDHVPNKPYCSTADHSSIRRLLTIRDTVLHFLGVVSTPYPTSVRV